MNENSFFQAFTENLRERNFEVCATFFHLPCVVMNNKQKYVFDKASDVSKWLGRYAQKLILNQDSEFGFHTQNSVSMSSKVRFVKMIVGGVEIRETGKKIDMSFTIANDEGGEMKIIVVVIDDV
jgi:hypothetical protein